MNIIHDNGTAAVVIIILIGIAIAGYLLYGFLKSKK